MSIDRIIRGFENLCDEGAAASINDAITGLSAWMLMRQSTLNEGDVELLSAIGSALLQARINETVAPAGDANRVFRAMLTRLRVDPT